MHSGSPIPEPAPPPTSQPAVKSKALGGVLTVLAIGLVALLFLRSCPRGTARGEIRSAGPQAEFVVQPVTCFSGDHWGFAGVWVVPETETSGNRSGFRGGLKILRGASGQWEAYVENPHKCQGFKCEQRWVDRRQCRLFDLVVEGRNEWLRFRGHARIDCSFHDDVTLKVDLTFRGCAAVPTGGEV